MASSVNRNQPCPCGSGKKHKNCCGRAGLTFTKKQQKQTFLALTVVAAVVVIFLLVDQRDTGNGSPPPSGFTPVTKPATSGDLTPAPGPAPQGKIWSPEHGHWHDIASPATNNSLSQPNSGQNAFPQPPGDAPAGSVWSSEHGHWHDAKTGKAVQPSPGRTFPQPPGEAPPGKIWSPEHGHWHDVAIIQPGTRAPK